MLLSSLQVHLKNELKVDNKLDAEEITYFDLPYELQQVALCESGGKQDYKGKTVKSKTGDLGIMQINEKVHGKTAKEMGLNLHDPNENMEFALWLYNKEGLKPWIASSYCWKKRLTLR